MHKYVLSAMWIKPWIALNMPIMYAKIRKKKNQRAHIEKSLLKKKWIFKQNESVVSPNHLWCPHPSWKGNYKICSTNNGFWKISGTKCNRKSVCKNHSKYKPCQQSNSEYVNKSWYLNGVGSKGFIAITIFIAVMALNACNIFRINNVWWYSGYLFGETIFFLGGGIILM